MGTGFIFLHAIGLSRHSWQPTAERVGEQFPVLAIDLAGFGDTPPPPDGDYSPRSLARHALAAARSAGDHRWVLVGNSLGAAVALAAAQAEPERVEGLVLVDAAAWPDALLPMGRLAVGVGRLPVARPLLRAVPQWMLAVGLRLGSGSPGHAARCRRALREEAGTHAFLAVLEALAGGGLVELSAGYPRIRCPALVLHGSRDPLVSQCSSERLAAALPGARFELLRGLGHFPQEQDPDLLARLCLEMGATAAAASGAGPAAAGSCGSTTP